MLVINLYILVLVVRQAGADYWYSRAVHKGLPGLIEKVFGREASYATSERISMVSRALQITPDNPRYHKELGTLYIAHAREGGLSRSDRLRFYKSAIDNFQKSVTLNPVDPIVQFHLASTKFKVSKDVQELTRAVERIKKIDPHNQIITKYKVQ